MRKFILLVAFISLSCTLPTALPASQLTKTVVRTSVPPSPNPVSCARVIASKALNVRDEKHAVIGWLYHDQEVKVSGTGEWITIYTGAMTGKVRSTYLEKCREETPRR